MFDDLQSHGDLEWVGDQVAKKLVCLLLNEMSRSAQKDIFPNPTCMRGAVVEVKLQKKKFY